MNRDDIIRMALEAGFAVDKKDGNYEVFEDDGYYIQTDRVIKFAALVAAAERGRLEPAFKQLEALMQVRETQPNKPCCLAERERIISVAQSRLAHERSALAHSFYRWHAASEWHQARCGAMEDMLAAIRARSNG